MRFFSNKIFTFLLTLLPFFCASIFSGSVFATDDLLIWKNVGESKQVNKQLLGKATNSSLKVRQLELDEFGLEFILNNRSNSSDISIAAKNTAFNVEKTIQLPLPDGSKVTVNIIPSSVMSDSLSKQFPQIKTWNIKSMNNDITGTIDFSHRGFRAMLMMPDGDRVFIEPDFESQVSIDNGLSSQSRYISFSKKQNKHNFDTEFNCGVHNHGASGLNFASKRTVLARPASDLITYRLAVATTGEYSQFHGGTKASVLSAIATTISRVNQIYRRDLGIQFELIDEQSNIIYLNPSTDPYSNSDIFTLIEENDTNLSSAGVLDKSKYDIGHVFGRGNVGGLAVVAGVCDDNEKAFGATGISSPVGDAFDLDYVTHELGHQLGGTHTFNSACNGGSERTGLSAVEPGSGTTIMAYPGICQPNNIQNNVDPQFHLVSISQIRTVTRSGGGSSCGIRTATSNENPTINAGNDVVVPARTPLILEAEGADADNDDVTYSWEQSDAGDVSNVGIDTGNNALIRSFPLTSENIRYIPRLSHLFAGTNSLGELLPVTNRDLNMVVTIRDGKGGLQSDLVKLQVHDTGDKFSVTSHVNNQNLRREETTEVRWNIAGTNTSPISCANVDIGLLTIDGNEFDILTTANDGVASITIPNDTALMKNARFKVSCNSSNFFNISSGNISILDQVGEGVVEIPSSGGGGSFNGFILFCGLMLMYIRKFYFSFNNLLKHYKSTVKLVFLTFPLLISVQACSTPVNNEKETTNTDSAMPAEFGDRFSSEKIKIEREVFYAKKLAELRSKNPESEVTKALQSNNLFYMVIPEGRGSSMSIPGLNESQLQSINCKTIPVDGMGDVLYGKNHILYRQELLKYMSEYNVLILSHC